MQIDSKHNQGKQKTFDPSFLRDKYKEERDKRLRPDGNDQYQEVKGDFSYFVEDPYIDETGWVNIISGIAYGADNYTFLVDTFYD